MSNNFISLLVSKALKFFGLPKDVNTVSVIVLIRVLSLTRFSCIYGTYGGKLIFCYTQGGNFIIRILREIDFGDSRSAKCAILPPLEALNFDF